MEQEEARFLCKIFVSETDRTVERLRTVQRQEQREEIRRSIYNKLYHTQKMEWERNRTRFRYGNQERRNWFRRSEEERGGARRVGRRCA